MSETAISSAEAAPTSKSALSFNLRTLFISTAGLALVMAGVAWRLRYARSEVFAAEVVGAMKEVQLGLMRYGSAKGAMPPAVHVDAKGQPLSSWRFRIPPFVGYNQLSASNEYDSAWDAPINDRNRKSWAADLFCVPRSRDNLNTNVYAVTGPGTAFDPPLTFRWEELPQQYIVLIEVADSKTHWMQPGDYDVTKLLAAKGRIGDHLHGVLPDRIHVLFADGELWGISTDVPMSALQPFLTLAGAEDHDRDQLLRPHNVY